MHGVRRMLALLGALGLLVASTVIVRSIDDSEPRQFCTLGGIISTRHVELDGKRFAIGMASQESELARGCHHYGGPVIQPNCYAWEDPREGLPYRIGKVGPFYTDGTCDGSGGGTRLDSAPPEIIDPPPGPRG